MFKPYLWLLHRLTGFLLVFFLVFHIFYIHYGEVSLYYEDIVVRIKNPTWKFFYLIFLLCGVYHGFYGITVILKEHVKSKFLFKLGIFLAILISLITLLMGTMVLR